MPDTLLPTEAAALAPTEQLNYALAEMRGGDVPGAQARMERLRARLPFWDEVPLAAGRAAPRAGRHRGGDGGL